MSRSMTKASSQHYIKIMFFAFLVQTIIATKIRDREGQYSKRELMRSIDELVIRMKIMKAR